MQKASAFALLTAGSLFVLVAPAGADPEYDRCIGDSRESEFAACGAAWVEREDGRLNAAWRELLPLLEGEERAALVAEQRAWIAFNENSCDYLYTDRWGTIGRNNWYPRCRADIIIARTAQLRDLRARIAEQGE